MLTDLWMHMLVCFCCCRSLRLRSVAEVDVAKVNPSLELHPNTYKTSPYRGGGFGVDPPTLSQEMKNDERRELGVN